MTAAARRYAKSQNETASPERMMVLLFQAALRHMRAGTASLEEGRPAEANAPLAKAVEIVTELHDTLAPGRAPELCERLAGLYRFTAQRLLEGNARRDPAPLREAERAFAPVAEAFARAVEEAAARDAAGGA